MKEEHSPAVRAAGLAIGSVAIIAASIIFGIGGSAGATALCVAGWVLFGISCLLLGIAQIWTHWRGTRPTGRGGSVLMLLAWQIGVGIAATVSRNDLVALGFIAGVIGPWVGVYNKVMDRRAGIEDDQASAASR